MRAVGFTEANADLLRNALIRLAQSEDVVQIIRGEHGTKFVIEAEIETPQSVRILLRTVWIIEPGGEIPRLVTAYRL